MDLCNRCKENMAMMEARTKNVHTNEETNQRLCFECALELKIMSIKDIKNSLSYMFPHVKDMSDAELLELIKKMNRNMKKAMESGSLEEIQRIMRNPDALFNPNFDEYDSDEDEEYADDSLELMFPDNMDAFDSTDGFYSEATDESEEKTEGSGVKVKDKKKGKGFKALNKFGTNLIDKALEGRIDKIVGRDKEVERVIQILNRRQKNNPILLGEPGVGKTAIAEGLAVKVAEGKVPEKLLDMRIYLLDLTEIVAGTQFRGQFEQRMKDIIKEASAAKNVVLVIDEVHNIMGAGEVNGGAMNAANILKPALAKGEVQIIGSTTLEEYRKHIEKDAALERRFQPVRVDEPSIEEAIEILEGIKKYYEDHHKVTISTEVITSAVKMASRYIPDRYLPDKAIDLIDEAGSRVNLGNETLTELRVLGKKFDKLMEKHDELSLAGDYAKAAEVRAEFLKVQKRIDELEAKKEGSVVTEADIAYVVESWTKIPVSQITKAESEKLLSLEKNLHQHVIGQESAISAVARAVRRARSGFKKRKKPASFMFVGPTGVGKTELAKALSRELFGNEDQLIRLDMSEYMEKHTVSKLIGAPPGYVGFDNGGQLTERVRRKPYSVILLDEIEKAHPDIYNMLLQILDDGRLTDSHGRTVFFENTVIIMTSNLGTSFKQPVVGFGEKTSSASDDEHIKTKIKENFRPEFINRVDEIVLFTQLTKEELSKVVKIQLSEVERELREKNITLTLTESALAFILEKGYDPKFGARPLRRVIQTHIEDMVADMYIKGDIIDGDNLLVERKEDQLTIEKIIAKEYYEQVKVRT